VEKAHQEAIHIASFVEASAAVAVLAQRGDMILTLGAGNVSQLGPIILERLEMKLVVNGHQPLTTGH
jgi:UDP-N-acetylmuramate--alanine ligase